MLLRKRDVSEMPDQDTRVALCKLKTPTLQVTAAFDAPLLMQLEPDKFQMLCEMPKLFLTETKPEQYFIEKM